MKVLQFIETGGPGGAERVVVTLTKAMRERGIDVAVLTLRTGWLTEALDAAGIPRFQLSSPRRLDIGLPFRIARLIKDQRFTVLHSHLLDSNFYGALAARTAGIAHLATEHGDIHHIKKKHLIGPKLRLLGLIDTHFSAVCQYTAEHLQSYGIRRRQICCIGNPVSLPLPAAAGERKRSRERLQLADDGTWIWAHIANLRPVKDQATLLRGFAESLERHPRQMLLIAGDGEQRQALERLAADLNLGNRVRFLGFQQDVTTCLYAADGFILSSRSEALPMSLLEAALAGLVIISSEVGGISEIIRREETGFLFPAGDAGALARRIGEVLDNPGRAAGFSDRARHLVETHYSIDVILDAYLSVY